MKGSWSAYDLFSRISQIKKKNPQTLNLLDRNIKSKSFTR